MTAWYQKHQKQVRTHVETLVFYDRVIRSEVRSLFKVHHIRHAWAPTLSNSNPETYLLLLTSSESIKVIQSLLCKGDSRCNTRRRGSCCRSSNSKIRNLKQQCSLLVVFYPGVKKITKANPRFVTFHEHNCTPPAQLHTCVASVTTDMELNPKLFSPSKLTDPWNYSIRPKSKLLNVHWNLIPKNDLTLACFCAHTHSPPPSFHHSRPTTSSSIPWRLCNCYQTLF